jgi:hypothetical protein
VNEANWRFAFLTKAAIGRDKSMTTLSSYLMVANNLSKWQSITAQTPEVSVQSKYFQDNIGNVKSADDFLNNARLFDYAMTAFGLGDMTYAKGLIKQVLQQGVTGSANLAHTLNNGNILAFAKAFDFVDNGSSTTSSSALVTNVVNRYVENSLEANQGDQNPGVQLALYFQRNAPNVTSIWGILADKNLLTVVQTALGISPLTSAEPVDTQAQLLSSQLKISDFQDGKKLQQFISRFAAMYDANNSSAGGASVSSTNAILYGAAIAGTDATGIDASLLLSLQNQNVGNF